MYIRQTIYLEIIKRAIGKYKYKNKFKKIKYFFFNCFLLIVKLIINITMLKFKIILNNEPVINCSFSDPNNGFKNFPINKSK